MRGGWLAVGVVLLAARAWGGEVRVGIMGIFRAKEVRVSGGPARTAQTDIRVEMEDGRRVRRKATEARVRCGGQDPVWVRAGRWEMRAGKVAIRPRGREGLWVEVAKGPGRSYPGWVEVRERAGRCLIVNHVELETYSRLVACREMGASGPAALRAQAVASRSYALAFMGKHGKDGFDFCDLTHCQVYIGSQACTRRQLGILEAVSGLLLLHQGRPAKTYYHSTCAGHTARSTDVWGPKAQRPYLEGVREGDPPHCARSPHVRWSLELDHRELCDGLRRALPGIGEGLCWLEVVRRGKGGWVSRVAVHAERSVELIGDRFHLVMGRQFGWGRFKSARFWVEASGQRVSFRGGGLGHGVGMCQYGAMGMEARGADHVRILKHYFPGTELRRWP